MRASLSLLESGVSVPCGARRGIEFDSERCLALRQPQTQCRSCADACASGFIEIGEGTVRIASNCLGCGRCGASCPTRALSVSGFEPPEAVAATNRPLVVDCWRVPVAHTPADGYRVPCLGGLSVSRLLALHADREGAPVLLLDRGWCGTCEAWMSVSHPATATLFDARGLLASLGVPHARVPRLEHAPLPRALAGRANADPLAQVPLSRRRFFGSALKEMTSALHGAETAPLPRTRTAATGQRLRPVERLKRLSLLADIAPGTELPASLFPALDAGEACANHQVCARVCPTGALSGYAQEEASGLRFDPSLCIECGACVRACPERAMQRYPESAPGQARTARALTRHLQRACEGCGAHFSSRNGAAQCPQCLKRTQLAHAGFSLTMSARRAAPGPRA